MSTHFGTTVNDNPSTPPWYDVALDDCYFCSEEAVNECCDCYKAVCPECSVVAWDQDQSLGAVLRCDECDERKPDLKLKISREQALKMLRGALGHLAATAFKTTTREEALERLYLATPAELPHKLTKCKTEIDSLIQDVRYGKAA